MKLPVDDNVEAKFDMAPMIDMVFLLLIFFMCVSRVSVSRNKEMELPTATKAAVPRERADRMVVNVDEEGHIFIGASQEISTPEQVRDAVKAEAAQNPFLKVAIRSDGRGDFGPSRKVLNACAEAGVDNVIFTAHKEE